MALRLTVIDQTPVHGDRPALAAAQSSVELAIACEGYGYHRSDACSVDSDCR